MASSRGIRQSHRRRRAARAGISKVGLTISLLAASGLVALVWIFWPGTGGASSSGTPIYHQVSRGVFRHTVTEEGEVESSSNVEVRCRVQSRSAGASSGTVILDIVPEGSWVEEGDLMIELDASALNDEKVLQEITVNSAYAAVVTAQSALDTAEIALEEYKNGTFKQEEALILAEKSVAEENLRRAEDYVRYSENMYARGFQNELQLEADRFAVEKAQTDLETADIKLKSLRDYTKKKMTTELEANIKVAEADLESMNATYESEKSRLNFINDQIEACKIYAPAAGQLVYANEENRRGGEDLIIEPGTPVREGQVIVRLPDPNQMQVTARVNEARIDMVKTGMAASIKLDAMPDVELKGKVIKVDDYPLSGSWWSNIKEYGATVEIEDPPDGLRPGLTAEVRIYVQHQDDVVQVPVQAVFEHQRQHYCIVQSDPEGERFEARPIDIGSTNDKFVVIDKGLGENDTVLLNPRKFAEQVGLPKASGTAVLSQSNLSAEEIQAGLRAASDSPGRSQGSRDREGASEGTSPDARQMVRSMIEKLDRDQDGKLSREEAPEAMRDGFGQTDTNGDGFLDHRELGAIVSSGAESPETTADATRVDDVQHTGDASSASSVGGGL